MEDLNKDKFLILKRIKKFILSLENLLVTFPKKDILTRDMIYSDSLELLEIIFKANYESNSEKRKDFKILALAKVNKLDFYIERAYHLKYISEKQCKSKSQELLEINKMIYTWCKNDE